MRSRHRDRSADLASKRVCDPTDATTLKKGRLSDVTASSSFRVTPAFELVNLPHKTGQPGSRLGSGFSMLARHPVNGQNHGIGCHTPPPRSLEAPRTALRLVTASRSATGRHCLATRAQSAMLSRREIPRSTPDLHRHFCAWWLFRPRIRDVVQRPRPRFQGRAVDSSPL